MKILITGSTGLLGQALGSQLVPLGDVVGLSRQAPGIPGGPRHLVCDLTDAGRTAVLIERERPDVVIHTQAMSDVDRCEREPETARVMNVQATTHLVQALRGAPARLLYVSTDYVFDGAKGAPYDERDAPHPISAYGQSKLEGEGEALRHPGTVIIRPSTLFGSGRMNFCDAIVGAAQEGRAIEAFLDQTTSPTYTDDIAAMIRYLIEAMVRPPHLRSDSPKANPQPGDRAFSPPSAGTQVGGRVVHITNAGCCTRVAFAHQVLELLGGSRDLVRPIRMAQQQRPAKRPAYSALATIALTPLTGRSMRPWDDALQAYLRQRRWLK